MNKPKTKQQKRNNNNNRRRGEDKGGKRQCNNYKMAQKTLSQIREQLIKIQNKYR